MQTELSRQVNDIRRRFAIADRESQWSEALDETGHLLALRCESDEERHAKVRAASSASYHAYLLGLEETGIFAYLDTARAVLDEAWEAAVNRVRAQISLHRARYRLLRNLGRMEEMNAVERSINKLLRELPAHEDAAEEIAKWGNEKAHYLRYRGEWRGAIAAYETLAVGKRWHVLDREYQLVLIRHYLASLACEWNEALALSDYLPPSLREVLDDLNADLQRVADPSDSANQRFPLFHAHFLKHHALSLATVGRGEEARDHLATAMAIVVRLATRKGVLLCRLFLGVIEGICGRRTEAERLLSSVAREAEGYYPRAAGTALLQLQRLHLLDHSLRGVVDFGSSSWSSGRYALNEFAVRDVARRMAYRTSGSHGEPSDVELGGHVAMLTEFVASWRDAVSGLDLEFDRLHTVPAHGSQAELLGSPGLGQRQDSVNREVEPMSSTHETTAVQDVVQALRAALPATTGFRRILAKSIIRSFDNAPVVKEAPPSSRRPTLAEELPLAGAAVGVVGAFAIQRCSQGTFSALPLFAGFAFGLFFGLLVSSIVRAKVHA